MQFLNVQSDPAIQSPIPFSYQISFVDCAPSEAVRFQIEEHLVKLGHLYDRIIDCEVHVRIPHKHSSNRFFHINIQLDIPGRRLAVSREPEVREKHTEISSAIRDSFHKLTRQLEDFLKARQRNTGKRLIVLEE